MFRTYEDRVNVIGVSANPKVLHAISEAARCAHQVVQVTQLGTELAELPALLEPTDPACSTLVFLDYPPVPTPELLQAAAQIRHQDHHAKILLMAVRDTGAWPDEIVDAGISGLLTPPFRATLFAQLIRSSVERAG